MILGLSTGILIDSLKFEEILDFYKELGCEAIELSPDHWRSATKELLKDFKYVSVHAGAKFSYDHSDETFKEMKDLEDKHKEIGFKCVVVHPPFMKDWSVLKNYDLPWVVENMDNTNTMGTTPEEVLEYTREAGCNVVLDLNHCFTHDPTMKLADKFYEVLGDRIVELHIGGYKDKDNRHIPLHESKQVEILKHVKDLPAIIEIDRGNKESLKAEFEYMKKMLL
jgi:sugar phosphate isomerase/epimerase